MKPLRQISICLGSFALGSGMLLAQRSTAIRSRESAASTSTPLSFFPFRPVPPCRAADTRGNGFTGPSGPPALSAGVGRNLPLSGQCGIPDSAEAVSLNVTVTNTQGPGFILIYPAGAAQPTVSTLNYVAGQTLANAAIVPLGSAGQVTIVAGVSGTDLIIDVNGYFGGSQTPSVETTFLGVNAGSSGAAAGNLGLGAGALSQLGAGTGNVAVGNGSLVTDQTGDYNTALGFDALLFNASGGHNVAVGPFALQNVSTGSGNIAIGTGAGGDLTIGSNNIYIDSPGFIGNETGTIRIGNANHVGTVIQGIATEVVSGVPVLINGGGRMGVATSSARFKEEIRDIGEESDGLMELRPVSFRYKPDVDPSRLRQFGLLAEEVAGVYPDLVTFDECGRPQAIRYQLLVPMLLNETQKDRRTIAGQEARLAIQERRLEDLSRRLEALESENRD